MRRFLMCLLLVGVFITSCQKEHEPVDPISSVIREKGPLLSGRVMDTDGNPIAGAAVTDGFVWSETDLEGNYKFESPYPERVRFVSVRIPSTYGPLIRDGRPVFWSSVVGYNGKERTADIVLQKHKESSDDFTMLMMADPQSKAYASNSITENMAYSTRDMWETVFADMREYISAETQTCYGICLGDVAQGTRSVYSQYCLGMESLGIPFFQVIGNHDHFTDGAETDDDSAASFEAIFGPRNYSFDLGQLHFVVIDNCIYKKDMTDYPFIYGVEDETLNWLKEDLARVSKDTPVMLCMHAYTFNRTGEKYQNAQELLTALQGFEKVYAWLGHWHYAHFEGKVNSPLNVSGVEAFVIPRVVGPEGNLSYSKEGSPRGYVVLEVRGKNVNWKYRPIIETSAPYLGGVPPVFQWEELPENAQMHVYPRGSYDDDFVYANVFLWDKHWEMPELKIAGKSFPMIRDYCYDLAYKENVLFYRSKGYGEDRVMDYMGDFNSHIFRVRVPDDATGMGIVEVVDRFGRTWSQEVSVDPVVYDDGCRHLAFDFRKTPDGCPSTSTSDVSISCISGSVDYEMTLSKGYHSAGENGEGYLAIDGKSGHLVLPSLAGHKLVGVTVHPSGNAFSCRKAMLVDASGEMLTEGATLAFWGDCADGWTLVETQPEAEYRLKAETSDFRIGELRLSYRRVGSIGYDGNSENFVVDEEGNVKFD